MDSGGGHLPVPSQLQRGDAGHDDDDHDDNDDEDDAGLRCLHQLLRVQTEEDLGAGQQDDKEHAGEASEHCLQ